MPPRSRKLVVAALIVEDRKLLLSKRKPSGPMGGLWEFPGGKIEEGEAPEAALQRELREELGCESIIGRIYTVIFHAYAEFDLYMLVYQTTLLSAPKALEAEEVRWFSAEELQRVKVLPADEALVAHLSAIGFSTF